MLAELFETLRQRNLVDWGVVSLGVSGLTTAPDSLSLHLVRDFANHQLETISIDDDILDVVVALATDSSLSSLEVREHLQRLCETNDVDLDRARRMWRVVALEHLIESIGEDSFDGMMSLAYFWCDWGWPDDTPRSMQGNLSPQTYYSAKNYQDVLTEHRHLLEKEWKSVL